MRRLVRAAVRWLTALPRPSRWWWPIPANLEARRREGLAHAPADVVATRFADASREDVELFNRGEGVAQDVTVSVLTVVPGEAAQRHYGRVQNLGPHTHYLVTLALATPPLREAPPGVWARVGWRDPEAGTESESWALLDPQDTLTFSPAPPPFD